MQSPRRWKRHVPASHRNKLTIEDDVKYPEYHHHTCITCQTPYLNAATADLPTNIQKPLFRFVYCHSSATLTEGFPCFFLSCKANAGVKLAKMGHGPHSSKLVVICVVLLLFVLFFCYLCCSMYCLYLCCSMYCLYLCCSMYCLCVNVYCTTATAC
jgi:hypothetical protein